MIIDELLDDRQMSRYKLSKLSGVPQATISDICSGKADMERCSAGTIYKIAKVLDVTVESLLEAHEYEKNREEEHRSSFEIFKSNVCHKVKDVGDLDFIINTLESDIIVELFQKKWYPEALYMLGMLDYLSRENSLPICTNYNDIRRHKLAQVVYPSSVLIQDAVMHSDEAKEEARQNAIPEFMRFNIVECEVRDIV